MLKLFCFVLFILSYTTNASVISINGTAIGKDFKPLFGEGEPFLFDQFSLGFRFELDLNDEWITDPIGRVYQKLELIKAHSSLDPYLLTSQRYESRFLKPFPGQSGEFLGNVFISVSRNFPYYFTTEQKEAAFWSLSAGTNDFMLSFSLDSNYQVTNSNLTIATEESTDLWEVRNAPNAFEPFIGLLNVDLRSSIKAVSTPTSLLFFVFLLGLLFRSKKRP